MGGHFYESTTYANNMFDINAKQCGPDLAGFGITDKNPNEPFLNGTKSFGIRLSGDSKGTGYLSGKGQLKMGAVIFGM